MRKEIVLNCKTLLLLYFGILMLTAMIPSIKVMPPMDVLAMQCLMSLLCGFCISIHKYTSLNTLLPTIFFINLILSILIRIMFMSHWNNPFGPVVFDALDYHIDASSYYKYSFFKFIEEYSNNSSLDDFGFTCILYIVYSLFEPELGIHVMLLINSLAVTIACKYVYKIGKEYLTVETAKLAVAVVGVTSFSMTTSAKGLKENFFILIVVSASYFLLQYRRNGGLKNLIRFFIIALCSVFFRLAILPIFILAYFSKFIQNSLKKRYFLIFVCLMAITIYIGLRIMNYLLIMRGFSDDIFLEHYENQYNDSAFGGLTNTITNLVFGILGAVPSFVSSPEKAQYITLNNFTLLVSFFSGSLFISGIYKILKNRSELFPLVVISLLNILMITVMSFSFDYRYRFVIFPLIIIISLYSLQDVSNRESIMHKLYVVGSLALTVMYNCFLG